ncbi:restriction endonuclease [Geoalkalibacter sp.]|uniref:restriction endonuclease n=1 Tax=Geoalkalibacter sp. TaxID=3041440 RepID=UPI00272EB91D|nr:restriction endonuclease [Geoalkalibacter sp.]
MARKRTSPFEDLVEVASKLPWWACLSLAAVSFAVLHVVASRPPMPVAGPEQIGEAAARGLVATMAMFGKYILAFAFSLAALISAINSLRQKKLYQRVEARKGTQALNEMGWEDFERLVSEYYRRSGFQVAREGGRGPDGGIDLTLRKDKETYLVQCKQWKAYKVGVKPVREFYGVMASRGAAGGYFVTSGEYTEEAKGFVRGTNLELVDGRKLREMIDAARTPSLSVERRKEVAVARPATPSPACPKCGAEMARRIARRGAQTGREFWGCSRFPKCNGARQIEDQGEKEPAPLSDPPTPDAPTQSMPTTKPCPRCNEEMRLRQFQSGSRSGQYFYGCTTCKKGWPADHHSS